MKDAGRWLLGILLILIGLFWLAVSAGWVVPAWFWLRYTLHALVHWWPVLFLVAGAGILLTRRTGVWLGLLALVGLLLAGFWVAAVFFYPWSSLEGVGAAPGPTVRVPFPQGGDVSLARLEVDAVAAALRVEGGAVGSLAEVRLGAAGPVGRVDSRVEGRTVVTRVRTPAPLAQFGAGRHSALIRLHETLPWSLQVDSAASRLDLDLREITVRQLDVDAAAAQLLVTFGALADGARISIDAGAGEVDLRFPRDVGVELAMDGIAGDLDIEGFTIEGDRWRSANWDRARVRVSVEMDAAFYRLRVGWLDTVSGT